MTLDNSTVIKLIEKGVSPEIKLSRKRAKKNRMHVTGKGVSDFLIKLDDYETHAQKLLREKLVKSNRSLFSFILRPVDKIFTAKGGSISYNLNQGGIDLLKSSISTTSDVLDIKKFLKKVVKKQYVIDPNGVLFIDVDDEGKLETHVVNTEEILWYSNKGNNVEAIIFESHKKKLSEVDEQIYRNLGNNEQGESYLKIQQEKKYYRVIDKYTDRIFTNEGGTYVEVVADRMDNFFGFVPARILGDEKDPNYEVFESIIADVVEDADALLRLVSTSTVHDLAHLYPRYWSYAQACTRCDGEGMVNTLISEGAGEDPDVFESTTCGSCGGSGAKTRTNPSDETVVPLPQVDDPIVAPNLMGFVSPDLQTAKFYVEKMDKDRNRMFQSMWGTTYEQGGKRETATGRFLDAQPVQDRLRDMSETFAKLHKFMIDCFGKVVLRDNSYQSSVSYGMRYILESPDDILKKYTDTVTKNVSDAVILDLRKQYFDAEYQNDAVELSKQDKLSKIEPFPTSSVKDILSLAGLSDQDKIKKAYYADWLQSLTEAQKTLLNISELTENFNNYINNKTIKQNETI